MLKLDQTENTEVLNDTLVLTSHNNNNNNNNNNIIIIVIDLYSSVRS